MTPFMKPSIIHVCLTLVTSCAQMVRLVQPTGQLYVSSYTLTVVFHTLSFMPYKHKRLKVYHGTAIGWFSGLRFGVTVIQGTPSIGRPYSGGRFLCQFLTSSFHEVKCRIDTSSMKPALLSLKPAL
jgi:hypothetical protein